MVTFTMGETVSRQRRLQTANPYAPAETIAGDWVSATAVDLENVAIAPSSTFASADPTVGQIVTAMSLFADYDADIQAGDRIVAASGTWYVEADRQPWRNPYNGSKQGLEVRVTRVTG